MPASDGPFIHPRAAERSKLCSSHNRPAPEAVTSARPDVQPTGAPAVRAFLRHRSTLVPFFARRASLHSAARQPAGTGSAQILRSMSPNSRRVRCPCASRSQQEPVVPGVLHQSAARLHQPLLETRERPALDPWRQDQSAPEIAQVVGQDAQLQTHFVRPETMARQPRPVRGLLAFLDPLLRGTPLVVEAHHRPAR